MLERHARGEWTAARLRREAGTLALLDLNAEEREEHRVRRAAEALGAADRSDRLDATRRRLAATWDALPLPERRDLLREVVAAIVVTDDDIEVVLSG